MWENVGLRRLAAEDAACFVLAMFFIASTGHAQSAKSGEIPSLPKYEPIQQVSGLIRISGSELGGLVRSWERGFTKVQPAIKFQDDLRSGDAAIGALEAGAADLAANGREPMLTEFLSFAEVFGNDGPFQITVATGSYNILGRTWAEVIYVNKDNPLTQLTVQELDAIFGSERIGGYRGYKWTGDSARNADTNIRTWGQLGLKGEWADKSIHTYGFAPTGMSNYFELTVFHGATKWNPNYRQYVETTAKQATSHDGTADQMLDDLTHDKYGIAWAGVAHSQGKSGVKPVAIGWTSSSPFLHCTLESVENRTYPLTRSIFMQMNRPSGSALDPKLREFLSYILSREGQDIVRQQGEYLPLTQSELENQRRALE